MPQLMNHDHPKWAEFLEKLEGPDCCNFRSPGGSIKELRYECDHTHKHCRHLMKEYGFDPLEIELSIKAFQAIGGYCDCEVLFNVAL